MQAVLFALVPVFGMVAAGAIIRKTRWLPDTFWPAAEKLTYYALFPALLVNAIATADLAALDMGMAPVALYLAFTFAAFLALPLKALTRISGPAASTLIQGNCRFNTYVILAVAAALYGTDGLTGTAVLVTGAIPLVNLFSVGGLVWYGRPESNSNPGLGAFVGQLLRNPLILSCVAGFVLNVTGIGIPQPLDSFIAIGARAALPLGLLAVGAGLALDAVRTGGPALLAMTAVKLVIAPLVAWGLCLAFGAGELATQLTVLLAGAPTASSAYILARRMGGDAPLMAAGITVTTLGSAVSLPLWLLLLT